MSTMSLLALEPTQATDTNILSGGSAESEQESGMLFSNLMEQHKDQEKSGKNTENVGKKEQEHRCDYEKTHSENTSASHASENTDNSNVTHDEKAKTELNTTDIENTEQSESDASTTPEQLLSFLNAAEKVLSTKEGNGDANSLAEKPTDLKTDKTLIAQSVSKQTESDEMAQKVKDLVNDLVKPKATEDAVTTAKSTTETDVEKNNAASIKANDSNENTSDAKNTDKKVLVESGKVPANVTSKDENIKNILATEKVASSEQSTNDTNKAEGNSDIVDKAGNTTDVKHKAVDNTTVKLTETAAEIEKGKNASEQIIPQVKPQAVTQQSTKPENSATEIKSNKKSSSELSGKSIDTQALDDENNIQPDSVVNRKNNATDSHVNVNNPNAGKTEQKPNNKDAGKLSSDITANQKTENSEELTEIVTDELSNSESKPLNSNIKLNQGINSLFDTLSQREASAAQSADRFIQNELSFENVMQNISADAVQTQKSAIIQQAETISIMRKDFTDAVKDKVMVMINQKIQQIDIQLDPPELGSMQVRINMQNDQAVVNFVVQNQQAKDALEQNMDKLKHMMADNGVDVGGANVKQQSSQSSMQDQNNQGSQGEFSNGEEGSAEQSISSEHAQEMKVSSTGVDYYA